MSDPDHPPRRQPATFESPQRPDDIAGLLEYTSARSVDYLTRVSDRSVAAEWTSDDVRRRLGGPLSGESEPPLSVIDSLARAGEHATTASTGPR